MSLYKLTLKPAGAIPRPLEMGVVLKPAVVAAPPAAEEVAGPAGCPYCFNWELGDRVDESYGEGVRISRQIMPAESTVFPSADVADITWTVTQTVGPEVEATVTANGSTPEEGWTFAAIIEGEPLGYVLRWTAQATIIGGALGGEVPFCNPASLAWEPQ